MIGGVALAARRRRVRRDRLLGRRRPPARRERVAAGSVSPCVLRLCPPTKWAGYERQRSREGRGRRHGSSWRPWRSWCWRRPRRTSRSSTTRPAARVFSGAAIPWMTYEDTVGGRPLGSPPGVRGWRQLAQRHRLVPRAQRRAARAVAAQVAVRRGGHRVLGREHAAGELEDPLGERGRVALGERLADRLAGRLEEAVGDLDARRAVAQRGERVDAALGRVVALDRARPVTSPSSRSVL